MIKITKNKKIEIGTLCDNCDNITRFSEEDDDFVPNYGTTYKIQFLSIDNEIYLCTDCLKELKSKIDKCIK